MMKSFVRRSFSFTKRDAHNETPTYERRPRAATQQGARSFLKTEADVSRLPQLKDNRLKYKFEAIDVLLQILLHQDELTLKEYTINESRIKILVIEDTEF